MKKIIILALSLSCLIGINARAEEDQAKLQKALSAALKMNESFQKVTLDTMKKKEKTIKYLNQLKERYEQLKQNEKLLTEQLNKFGRKSKKPADEEMLREKEKATKEKMKELKTKKTLKKKKKTK